MAAGIVANMLPHVEAELKQFVISNPEATGAMIQQKAAEIMNRKGSEIYSRKLMMDRGFKGNNGQ